MVAIRFSPGRLEPGAVKPINQFVGMLFIDRHNKTIFS